ncbi:MAG: hypothetical protein ACXABY_04545 [Candidatus Thorarchaeota archaeon]
MSMPKKGKDGKYIDHHTNTVEDAAKFEAYYNSEPPEEPDFDYEEEEREPDGTYLDGTPFYDDCKCSDPCCPCTGYKRGVP